MKPEEERKKQADINPAARRDRPGEPHEDLAEREEDEPPPVKPYQEEPPDPLGPGGIGG